MSDFERINSPRVDKIIAMIDTIEKSARSNRVDPSPMLARVHARLMAGGVLVDAPPSPGMPAPRGLPEPSGSGMPPPSNTTAPRPVTSTPTWWNIRQAAEQADLSDLGVALAVYMNRVDELLHERKNP